MEGGGGKHPPLALHQPKKPGTNRVKLGNVYPKLGFYSMSSFQNSISDQYFTSASKVIENIKYSLINFCKDYNFVGQFTCP